jgi:hypothetical protein
MTSGRLLLTASRLALAAVSLPGKLADYRDATNPFAPQPAEAAAAERLGAAGWRAYGTLALTENGAYRVHAFESEACGGSVLLSAVRPNGEADAMLAELAGSSGKLFFIQGGRVYRDLPHFRATLEAKLAPLLQRFGLLEAGVDHDVLAVVVTEECQTAELPW